MKRDAKPESARRGPPTCCVCGAVVEKYGPGWDGHMGAGPDGELTALSTCSQTCRKAKGLPERQPGLVLR